MIKNSDTIVSILIPVTKNEASCLPDTLRSVRNDVIRYGKKAEIIVIANCCKGTSDKVAQSILETGWGQKVPSDKYSGEKSNNLFGIKSKNNEPYIISTTWEVYNGLKYVVDKIHEKGYQAGLWLAPFSVQKVSLTAKEHPDWLIKDENGNFLTEKKMLL